MFVFTKRAIWEVLWISNFYFMKTYNKLVRDKIPEIIAAEGTAFKTRILDDAEYKTELLKKLLEEGEEVSGAAGDKKELIKEIGDVMEVVEALISVFGLSIEEIRKVKADRKNSRGGFDQKIFLEYTEE